MPTISGSGGASALLGTDGWTASGDTWTFASSTTFTIAGVDRTATFTPGTRLKLTNSSLKYFVVVSSAFSTDTTVTVAGGSDYSLANAAISAPSYSYQVAPQGFPTWFNWTPGWTGYSANPSVAYAKFSMLGKQVTIIYAESAGGTSNATTLTITGLPIATASGVTQSAQCCIVVDSGTTQTSPGNAFATTASTTITVQKTYTGAAFTASGTKSVNTLMFTYYI